MRIALVNEIDVFSVFILKRMERMLKPEKWGVPRCMSFSTYFNAEEPIKTNKQTHAVSDGPTNGRKIYPPGDNSGLLKSS